MEIHSLANEGSHQRERGLTRVVGTRKDDALTEERRVHIMTILLSRTMATLRHCTLSLYELTRSRLKQTGDRACRSLSLSKLETLPLVEIIELALNEPQQLKTSLLIILVPLPPNLRNLSLRLRDVLHLRTSNSAELDGKPWIKAGRWS